MYVNMKRPCGAGSRMRLPLLIRTYARRIQPRGPTSEAAFGAQNNLAAHFRGVVRAVFDGRKYRRRRRRQFDQQRMSMHPYHRQWKRTALVSAIICALPLRWQYAMWHRNC